MKISLIQTQLYWEQPQKNLEHFEALIEKIKGPTELIVLPEMFNTGFTMRPESLAEPHNGATFQWMQKMASKNKSVITGSVATRDKGSHYNRLYWVEPDGKFKYYDKRHLFRMGREDKHYSAGAERMIAPLNNWKICPLVCYDLRFPVWSRNKCRTIGDNKELVWDYDVLIYVANWPTVRRFHWQQLLLARAIENQCYVVGLNRVGIDGNDFLHSGDSVVIGPKGEILSDIRPNEEQIETVTLDLQNLQQYRNNFPAGLDADDFSIQT
jgi:omega-amidase